MINYVLKSLYQIKNPFKGASIENMLDYENFLYYKKMQKISINSLHTYLKGSWNLKYIQGEKESLQDSFIFTFNQTYELWKSKKCNILYIDPDVLFLNSVDIFNENYTSCYGKEGKIYTCGVRYFPHNMPEKLWENAFDKVFQWNYDQYDYEQEIVYSELNMHGKKVNELVCEVPINRFEKYNIDKPIIHLHSSRNPLKVLLKMQSLNKND